MVLLPRLLSDEMFGFANPPGGVFGPTFSPSTSEGSARALRAARRCEDCQDGEFVKAVERHQQIDDVGRRSTAGHCGNDSRVAA